MAFCLPTIIICSETVNAKERRVNRARKTNSQLTPNLEKILQAPKRNSPQRCYFCLQPLPRKPNPTASTKHARPQSLRSRFFQLRVTMFHRKEGAALVASLFQPATPPSVMLSNTTLPYECHECSIIPRVSFSRPASHIRAQVDIITPVPSTLIISLINQPDKYHSLSSPTVQVHSLDTCLHLSSSHLLVSLTFYRFLFVLTYTRHAFLRFRHHCGSRQLCYGYSYGRQEWNDANNHYMEHAFRHAS